MAFLCASCGKEHDSLPEPAYQRPDDVWALSAPEQAQRVIGGSDLCSLEGEGPDVPTRFFLRGTVPLRVPEIDDDWAVGVWAEVAEADFHRYRELHEVDASSEAPFDGVIANAARGFEDNLGARVLVQLGSETQRPTFRFPAGSLCSLATLQVSGITVEQVHSALGSFE